MTFEELKKKILSYDPQADILLVEKAYRYAEDKHRGFKRLSGDDFITHPLEVAGTLAELEQDVPTIAAALLHDTIEDIEEVTFETISKKFSPEIAHLVEGVTKLSQLVYDSKEERQAENFRKMFVAMGEDLRVIIIKLSDRLHNMRTLKFLPPGKIKETSKETMEIFAPLAHRLGMWKLKWELEDLAFSYLFPKEYEKLRQKVAGSRKEREEYITKFIADLKTSLKDLGLIPEISGRPKHLYSIYRKMKDQGLEFEDIYDLTAVRAIFKTIKDCYEALGVVHAKWKPIPGRFRDYIAVPKSNGYQSLHTTVFGEKGRPVEIQMRTQDMHRMAEYGVAAHWVYKEVSTDRKFDQKMAWFRQLLETQAELKDAKDFMDSLKIDLFVEEVFVFTPKGKVIQLPQDSTPIDFAYHVHTEVGHRANGAKVDGRIVPLDYHLKNGEIVEIITGKADAPSLDWLNFIKTSAARTKIKSWFKRMKRGETIERGELALREELKKMRIHPELALTEENLKELVRHFELKSIEELYLGLGYAEISIVECARRLKTKFPGMESEEEEVKKMVTKRPRKKKMVQGIKVTGQTGIMVKLSRCCRPLPGEEIIGLVTKGRGVAVHRQDCSSLVRSKAEPDRLLKVEWDLSQGIFYPVEIEVEAFDRIGVLKDILEKVADKKVNVSSADIKTKRGSTMFLKLVVDVEDLKRLTDVIQAIRDVADVYDVKRVES